MDLQEPPGMSGVKIEIDVAEETPEAWSTEDNIRSKLRRAL